MEANDTESHLLSMITNYLRGRDKTTMESVVSDMQTCLPSYFGRIRLVLLAKVQDRVGWDCMLKGRIPTVFVTH